MTEGNGKPNTFEQWQSQYRPKRVSVEVCFDGDVVARLQDVEQELKDAHDPKLLGKPEELQSKVDALREEARSKTHTIVFETVGRRTWRSILVVHPPTPEQKQRSPLLDFNPETFPAPAIAESCVEPGLTIEQAQWLLDTLDVGDADRIWAACLDANITGVSVPKAPSIASARVGEKKSTQQ